MEKTQYFSGDCEKSSGEIHFTFNKELGYLDLTV